MASISSFISNNLPAVSRLLQSFPKRIGTDDASELQASSLKGRFRCVQYGLTFSAITFGLPYAASYISPLFEKGITSVLFGSGFLYKEYNTFQTQWKNRAWKALDIGLFLPLSNLLMIAKTAQTISGAIIHPEILLELRKPL